MMQEPRFAKHVSQHFDHVLVDEYQDTNRLQAEILLAMRPDGDGVTVVGDDAQAIYSFRAAAVDNILGFPDKFTPRAEVVTLAQNYRSTQPVLDVANALMAEAPRQYRKHLLSTRGDGPRPKLVATDDLPSQAEYICSQVLKKREMNVALRRQAVLFRTGEPQRPARGRADPAQDSFREVRRAALPRGRHVKDLLAILRWADNPRNELAGVPRRCSCCRAWARSMRARSSSYGQEGPATRLQLAASTFQPPPDSTIAWNEVRSTCIARPGGRRSDPGPASCAWCATGTSRISSGSTSTSIPASAISTRSSCSSAQQPSRERFLSELTLDPPQSTSDLAGQPLSTRTSSCSRPCTPRRAWSGTACTC
jgi:DNA helicase II / ATP-dependent DNA helicase PcrA